jgi:hypothetical protein
MSILEDNQNNEQVYQQNQSVEFSAENNESLDFSSPDSLDTPQQAAPVAPVEDQEVQKAKKFGYLTEQEYRDKHGSLEGFKSPQQFNKFGEAYDEVKDVLKTLRDQNIKKDKIIDMFVEQQKQTMEQSVTQARKQLEYQLRQAEELGDTAAIRQLSREQFNLEQQDAFRKQQQQAEESRKIDEAFIQRNGYWWNQPDGYLRQEAIDISNRIKETNPGMPYAQIVRNTEMEMRYIHPELNVVPQNRPHISASQSNVNKIAAQNSSDPSAQLSAADRAEFNTLQVLGSASGVKYTIKDFQEYKQSLKDQRGNL